MLRGVPYPPEPEAMRKKPHAHAPDRTSPGPSPIPGGERIAARADSARHPKVPHRRNGQGFSGMPSNREGRLQGRPVIALVVPCYNESAALEQTVPRLTGLVGGLIADRKVNPDSFIVLVDDGSRDDTWAKIEQAAADHPRRVQGISLCRNYGHQYALLCGLEHVTGRCDAAVSIDAYLQDDIGVIPDMVDQYLDGRELVFGVRRSRGTDSWFKRSTALLFYRLMAGMVVPIVENHADFRLMSHTTLANLRRFGEVNLFLRGLSTLLHKHTGVVYYDRTARTAGDTKYPLSRMLALAWPGLASRHLLLHRTPARDLPHRWMHLPHLPGHVRLGPGLAVPRKDGAGMVLRRHPGQPPGRHPHAVHRHRRRIPGNDLHVGQEQTQVPGRPGDRQPEAPATERPTPGTLRTARLSPEPTAVYGILVDTSPICTGIMARSDCWNPYRRGPDSATAFTSHLIR